MFELRINLLYYTALKTNTTNTVTSECFSKKCWKWNVFQEGTDQ